MKKLSILLAIMVTSLSQAQFEIIEFNEGVGVLVKHANPIAYERQNYNPPSWRQTPSIAGSLEVGDVVYWSESAQADHKTYTAPASSYFGFVLTNIVDVFCIPTDERRAEAITTYAVTFRVLRETQVRVLGRVGGQSQSQGGGLIDQHQAGISLHIVNTGTTLCGAVLGTHLESFDQLVTLRPGITYIFSATIRAEVSTLPFASNSRATASTTAFGYLRLPKQIGPDPLGFL